MIITVYLLYSSLYHCQAPYHANYVCKLNRALSFLTYSHGNPWKIKLDDLHIIIFKNIPTTLILPMIDGNSCCSDAISSSSRFRKSVGEVDAAD